MRFAELTIIVKNDEVKLIQPLNCEDDQVITFPIHQAKAICEAILKAIGQ